MKNKLLLLFLITIVSFIPISFFGQTDTILNFNIDPDQFELNNDNIDISYDEYDLIEKINNIANENQQVYNINDLSEEVALQKFIMTDFQYYQLLKYIDLYGELVSIYELGAIEGFSYTEIKKWIPCIEVKPKKREKQLFNHFFKNSKSQFIIRDIRVLENQTGYSDAVKNRYAGTPDHFSFKYLFKTNDWLQIGFSGEKDPGESFFKGDNRKGFNFYSYHIQIKNIGLIRKIIVGDYKVQFGQGVIMGSGLNMSGNTEIQKINTTIQGVYAMNEIPLIKGVSVEMGNHKLSGVLMGGYQMDSDSIMGTILGGSFKWSSKLLRIGSQFIIMNYQNKIGASEKWYQKYRFVGENNMNFSIDHQLILGSILFFGEWGMSKNGGLGIVEGLKIPIDPATKLFFLYRNYSKTFQSISGNSYCKGSSLNNESGLFSALKTSINNHLECEIFADLYQSKWLKYLLDRPCQYIDLGIYTIYSINRDSKLELKYWYKTIFKNQSTSYYNEIATIRQHRFKFVFHWNPLQNLKFKTEISFRINHHLFQLENTDIETYSGFLVSQDIQYQIQNPQIQIQCRVAVFDTDSYDERIYAYENDINYCFTINNYYDKGVRYYLLFKYKTRIMDIQLKVSRTIYHFRTSVGSGNNEIIGKHKTEIKAQTIFNF
jgi:hypothetical protein